MVLEIIPYQKSDETRWDAFCTTNTNSTFLHTRRYLSYHQDRFIDLSLLIFSNNRLLGLFPIAISKSIGSVPMSHPGISYGGIIHAGQLLGDSMADVFDLTASYLKNLEYKKFIYTPTPYIYNNFPAQDDIYALFARGAMLTRCELTSTLYIKNRRKTPSKRINLKLTTDSKYSLDTSFDKIGDFWKVLEENLSRKYKTLPTHSLKEIINLKELFPDNLELITVSNSDECIAGAILYWTKQVCHIQYMSANDIGRKKSALDVLIEKVISLAIEKETMYLDFGHSNERKGQDINLGLYNFKSKFGGGGVALLQFTLNL